MDYAALNLKLEAEAKGITPLGVAAPHPPLEVETGRANMSGGQ